MVEERGMVIEEGRKTEENRRMWERWRRSRHKEKRGGKVTKGKERIIWEGRGGDGMPKDITKRKNTKERDREREMEREDYGVLM